MAFGFFSKSKEKQDSQTGISSIFNKLTTQSQSKPNKSLTHDLDDEYSFSVPSNKDLFANVHFNENVNLDSENVSADIPNSNPFNSNLQNNLDSDNQNNSPYSELTPNQEDDSIRSKYYTYAGDESYLNEDGRDSDHLYIGPGEPLTPRRRKIAEVENPVQQNLQDENQDNTSINLSENTAVQGNVENLKNSASSLFDTNTDQQSNEKEFDSSIINSAPKFVKTEPSNNNFASPDLFNNVRDTSELNNENLIKEVVNNKDNKSEVKGISSSLTVVLFFRKLFASLFTYTNLGALFSRSSMNLFGPSSPSFMTVPYFIVGLLCSLVAMLFSNFSNPLLSASAAFTMYVLFVGCNGFAGISQLLSTLTFRKLEFYGKTVIVLVIMQIFIACFDRYIEIFKIDFYFTLGFAVITMLSAFTASSLNYGHNDDPLSTYGSLSLTGLIVNSVIVLLITFTVLDWQIALSMVGICLFVRVSIGQYMYVKDLNAGIANVCAVQMLTLVLLMLDLIFAAKALPFISSFIK